jgi:hypothetical protein
VLDCIRETLETLAEKDGMAGGVHYGMMAKDSVDVWNYFVFNRQKTTKDRVKRRDLQTYYEVHIIHEDYIPEGYVEEVIAALEDTEAVGVKLRMTDQDVQYDYVRKGKTEMVVEIATIVVFRPEKRC